MLRLKKPEDKTEQDTILFSLFFHLKILSYNPPPTWARILYRSWLWMSTRHWKLCRLETRTSLKCTMFLANNLLLLVWWNIKWWSSWEPFYRTIRKTFWRVKTFAIVSQRRYSDLPSPISFVFEETKKRDKYIRTNICRYLSYFRQWRPPLSRRLLNLNLLNHRGRSDVFGKSKIHDWSTWTVIPIRPFSIRSRYWNHLPIKLRTSQSVLKFFEECFV